MGISQGMNKFPRFEIAHLRELIEQGFEVAVVKDATAGARHPELGDGYEAAITNFGYIANEVVSTDEIVKNMESTVSEAA
jgi:nicotinamidase-related amidase